MPKISIIVPVYNAQTYLQDCLDSLVKQSLPNIELVLVNDGSTDDSLAIMNSYMAKDGRIKVIDKPNAGVSEARNTGIRNASGQYIMFVDADDYLHDLDALQKLCDAADQNKSAVMFNIAYEGKDTTYPFKSGVYSLSDSDIFLASMVKNEHINSPCNKIYLKEVIDKHKIRFNKNIEIAEDLLFNIRYFEHSNSIYYLNSTLYFYRTSNDSSITSRVPKNKYDNLMYVNSQLASWLNGRESATLDDAVKYIRLKNIFSCVRDLNPISTSNSTELMTTLRRYKNDTPKLIVKYAGVKAWLMGVIYSNFSISLTSRIIWRMYPARKTALRKINVLQVCGAMNMGGTEAFLMNTFRNIDRDKFNFVFLCFGQDKFDYEDEINELGGKIIRIKPMNLRSSWRHIKDIERVIKQENIDIVHAHTYLNSMFSMIAAKKSGVKIRITHSHFTESGERSGALRAIYEKVARFVIAKQATHYLACGAEAGKSLFPANKFEVLENGIDLEAFHFNPQVRSDLRDELHIPQDSTVVGHIGRFEAQKNHSFILDVFGEYLKLNPNAYLLLVGDGSQKTEIQSKLSKLDFGSRVIFTGKRRDTARLYNAMDIFILPSLYEGLPVTAIEAQANGLSALLSDVIDHEVALTDCVHFYPLNKSKKSWAKYMYKMNTPRINTRSVLQESKYNIVNAAKKVESLYESK